MKRIRVAVIFGGRSAEHEVSLQSARNIITSLDKNKYEPVLIGIGKDGRWRLHDAARFLLNAENPKLIALNMSGKPIAVVPSGDSDKKLMPISGKGLVSADVAFPVLHGPFGEDGTVQGLLKLLDIPFVGAGVLGSAVGMDKDVQKRLCRDAGIPMAKFMAFEKGTLPAYEAIVVAVGEPFFIKPANLGSSVGIHKVKTKADFAAAVEDAFCYDTKVLAEECIRGREIECSVLGNEDPIASVPGEVIPSHEFYSYEAKYIDEKGAVLKIPALLTGGEIANVQKMAIRVFKALCLEGMTRVDFFLKESGEILFNEVNTIPGFTNISMYPKLWEASGISNTELIDRLIKLAIERHARDGKLRTSHV